MANKKEELEENKKTNKNEKEQKIISKGVSQPLNENVRVTNTKQGRNNILPCNIKR